MLREVKCKYCGKIFTTEDKRKKFCNDECRKAYYDNYRKEHYKEVYARYIEDDPDRSNRYQRERRERKREEQYREVGRKVMALCGKGEQEIAEFLMKTFTGIKKGE